MFNVENLIKTCKDNNYKITPQRLAILKYYASIGHTSAEEIYEFVVKEHPYISFNTVYMTLKMLVDLREIKELYINKERTFYDLNKHAHNHIICKVCSRIEDISPDKTNFTASMDIHDDFELESYQIEFYGICKTVKTNNK